MKKLVKFENSIKEKILKKENIINLFIMVFLVLALLLRFIIFEYKSSDYSIFLSEWFDKIKKLGGIKALKYNIGDYNVPYVTIISLLTYIPISSLISIKMVSIIFDFIGAYYTYKLVKICTKENKFISVLSMIFILFLPTVWLNSALWAQCDFIYVTFIIMSLYYLKKNKISLSFVLLGLSFSFKLQFIFILPLYLILYFKEKNISIFHFLLIPFVNIIACLPSIIMGRKIIDCIKIYFNQTSTYKDLTVNYPNLYMIFKAFFNRQTIVLIILTVFILLVISFILIYKNIDIKRNLIKYSLLISWLVVYLLPRMHERYAFLPEILSIIYIFIYKKNFYVPVVLEAAALVGYYNYFTGGDVSELIWFTIIIIEFVAITKFTIDSLTKKEIIEELV